VQGRRGVCRYMNRARLTGTAMRERQQVELVHLAADIPRVHPGRLGGAAKSQACLTEVCYAIEALRWSRNRCG